MSALLALASAQGPDIQERMTLGRFAEGFLRPSPYGISGPLTEIAGVGGSLGLWILEADSRSISYGVAPAHIAGPPAAISPDAEADIRIFETRPGEKPSQTYARALLWMSQQAVAELEEEER